MVLDVPRAILAGDPVSIPEPIEPSLARGFLARLLS
jgi:hypothetical protein